MHRRVGILSLPRSNLRALAPVCIYHLSKHSITSTEATLETVPVVPSIAKATGRLRTQRAWGNPTWPINPPDGGAGQRPDAATGPALPAIAEGPDRQRHWRLWESWSRWG
jgi:hypothetical protein